MKEFADDNNKFDENSRKSSKLVKNTEGKGEIAHYEQFVLFPQRFQKTHKNKGLFGKGWLVVLGFNTTLTAEVISWRSVTHMCLMSFSHQC